MKTETRIGAKPKNAWNYQKLEGQGKSLPKSLPREHGPADTLISDFWPP